MEKGAREQKALLNINNKSFPVYEGINTIGRNLEATLNIKHKIVSHSQAIIVILKEQHFISDVKSSNGTFVEGLKLEPFKLYELNNNDQVIFGNLRGKYELGEVTVNNPTQDMLTSTQSFYDGDTQLLESDIHLAKTQEYNWIDKKPQIPKLKAAKDENVLNYTLDEVENNFNDEDLPILANTQQFSQMSSQADADTVTDKEMEIPEDSTEALDQPVSPNKHITADDDITDCEDNVEVDCKASFPKASSDEDSNDSIEFLKSTKKNEIDEDSSFISKKSPTVMPTEDFNEDSAKQTNVSVIKENETFCDSIVYPKSSSYLDDSIPATQYPEMEVPKSSESLSNESFKLKLFEMDSEINQSEKNAEESFLAPTQEIVKSSIKLQFKNSSMPPDEDIYDSPTQKIILTTENLNNTHLEESTPFKFKKIRITEGDIFTSPTQKIVSATDISNEEEDADFYGASTQKLHIEAPALSNIYDDATQKVDKNLKEDDIFLMPTQYVNNKENDELNIYEVATQKVNNADNLDEDDIFLMPTQYIGKNLNEAIEKDNQEADEDAIYDLATQRINQEQVKNDGFETRSVDFEVITEKEDTVVNVQALVEKQSDNCGTKGVDLEVITKKEDKIVNIQASVLKQDDNSETKPVDLEVITEKEDKIVNIQAEVEKQGDNSETNPVDLDAITEKEDAVVNTQAVTEKQDDNISIKHADSELISERFNLAVSIHTEECNNELSADTNGVEKTLEIDETLSIPTPADNNSNTSNIDATEPVITEKVYQEACESTKNRRKFCFKKRAIDLDASLSILADNPKAETSKEPVNNSESNIEVNETLQESNNNDSDSEIIQRSLRDLSSSEIVKPKENSINTINESSINLEVNQSLAILESKMSKTKKLTKSSFKVSVSVPRNRRSMSLSMVEKPADVSKQGTSNNVDSSISFKRTLKSADSNKNPNVCDNLTRRSKRTRTTVETKDNSNVDTTARKSSKRKKAPSENEVEEDLPEDQQTPPKKQKQKANETLTPQRGLRKQKPKVVFTLLDNPQLECLIKQLGGSIVDSVETSTVLVTEHVKRSQKLLSAVGLGKPICSPRWITESKKAQQFLDPWDFVLEDLEAEKKWHFSLRESLNRSRARKMFDSMNFQIQVTEGQNVLKGAIEACGGKCLSKIPAAVQNLHIISSPENRSKCARIIKKHPDCKVIEAEAIFDGVLRQEMRFSRHYI